jgi:hypothetical protein
MGTPLPLNGVRLKAKKNRTLQARTVRLILSPFDFRLSPFAFRLSTFDLKWRRRSDTQNQPANQTAAGRAAIRVVERRHFRPSRDRLHHAGA